jgi:hypothetical protein
MHLAIKGMLFTSIITLCGVAPAHALPGGAPPQSAGSVTKDIQPPMPTADDPCGLGAPPTGGCAILVTAYCEAYARCIASTTKAIGGISTGAAAQGGQSGAGKPGLPSVFPHDVLEGAIEVECIRRYGCGNSQSQ